MPEHALIIPRVSSVKQREEDQTPGLLRYAEGRGYVPDHVLPVHGKSAFHGRHVKAILTAVDLHVKHGNATVVIFRHVDRSSREGIFKGIDLFNQIMAAGARIEFSEQPFLTDNPGWIGMLLELAKQESQIKQDRKLQGNDKKRASGQMLGKAPWGYDPVYGIGLDPTKTVQVNIKPNSLGRKWIPRIFDAEINGKSLHAITEMLRGVPSPSGNELWDYDAVRRIIHNTTYCGSMKNNPFMAFEALVTVEVWKQANAALAGRHTGRGTTKREPALVKPICAHCYGREREGAPSGVSPMYRVSRAQWSYYVCVGHGPQRRSCAAKGIPVAALDELIDATMAADPRPRIIRVPVAGDDNDERRKLISEKIAAAVAAGDFALVGELSKDAMQIGPSEHVSRIEDQATGHTVGQHWKTLTRDEKRDELTNWTILAKMGSDGLPEVSLTWRSPWKTS